MSLLDDAARPPVGHAPLRVVFRAPSARHALDDPDGTPAVRVPAAAEPDDHSDGFRIVVHSEGDDDLMTVAGEIDVATAPALHAVLRQLLIQGRRHVAVDFGAVTFLDATALTFVLAAARDLTAAGGSLTILGHNPLLKRLITVAGLTGVLEGSI